MNRFMMTSMALLFSAQAWAGGVAVVDFQRALLETEQGKATLKKLEGMYATRRTELENKQKQLETEFKDFESRAMIISDAAKQEAGEKLMQKQQAFQQLYMQYEGEMQQQQAEAFQEIELKMRSISEKVAKEKGYDLVLDRAAVVYMGGTTIDMTDDLVKRYNAGK